MNLEKTLKFTIKTKKIKKFEKNLVFKKFSHVKE